MHVWSNTAHRFEVKDDQQENNMTDIIEIDDVTFTKCEAPGKVNAMHNDLYKAFLKEDGWVCPVLTFDAETTQQAKALYAKMLEAGQIEVVDDIYEP